MTAPSKMTLPWWVSGDTNAFFGLGFNTLVNVLVLSGLCVGVVHMAARIPRILFAAMAEPSPAPSITMPASASPRATARATPAAMSG